MRHITDNSANRVELAETNDRVAVLEKLVADLTKRVEKLENPPRKRPTAIGAVISR